MPTPISNVTNSTPSTVAQKASFAGVQVGTVWGEPGLQYTVKSGDTLSKIARQVGSDANSLFQYNRDTLTDPSLIKPGQKLALPLSFHVVQKGDTFYGIARQLGIDPKMLMALNNAPSNGLIKVGQQLKVPAVAATPEAAAARAQMKALVEDMAKAEGKLWFGGDSFQTVSFGNTFMTHGPAESGYEYAFSDDLKTLRITGNGSGYVQNLSIKSPDDFRRALVADLMTSVLHAREGVMEEKHPEFKGQWGVLKGPELTRDGKINFLMDEPLEFDTEVSYDTKTGQLTFISSGKGEPETSKAGLKPSEVADALAKRLGLKLPIYA
jgi:LysM repeat protein